MNNNLVKINVGNILITKILVLNEDQNQELTFVINWSNLIEIINLLNQYTYFLMEPAKFNDLVVNKLNEKRIAIINLLNNLPIKEYANQQLKLDIKLPFKNKLIRNLNDNYESTKNSNLINEQIKNNLISANKKLVIELMQLENSSNITITPKKDLNEIQLNLTSPESIISDHDTIKDNEEIVADKGQQIYLNNNSSDYAVKFISDNEEITNQMDTDIDILDFPFQFSMHLVKDVNDIKSFDEDIVNYLIQHYVLSEGSYESTADIFDRFNQYFKLKGSVFSIKNNLGRLIRKIFDTNHLKVKAKLKHNRNVYYNLKYVDSN